MLICFGVSGTAPCICEYSQDGGASFKQAELKQQALYGNPSVRFIEAKLTGLRPGEKLQYRINLGGQSIFESTARALPPPDKEVRVALAGDIACGSITLRRLLNESSSFDPDLLILTGDLLSVPANANAYLGKFFPEFATVMSKTPVAVCPGDKDISTNKYDPDKKDNRNLDLTNEGMAFFSFWKEPLNGPGKAGEKNTPVVQGAAQKVEEFQKAAGSSYPRIANYSFDLGDSHWLVLDGGAYVDFTDEDWRKWIKDDLKSKKKTWNFAVIHQAPFSSDPNHGEEQRARLLSSTFEEAGVDIVFSGHSHSYQRSCPMHFSVVSQAPNSDPDTDPESGQGYVYGKFKVDKNFDGVEKRKPDGVIYVVTGAASADLAEKKIQDDKTRWQPYTKMFYSEKGSISLLQLSGKELVLKQVSEEGQEIDRIRISK